MEFVHLIEDKPKIISTKELVRLESKANHINFFNKRIPPSTLVFSGNSHPRYNRLFLMRVWQQRESSISCHIAGSNQNSSSTSSFSSKNSIKITRDRLVKKTKKEVNYIFFLWEWGLIKEKRWKGGTRRDWERPITDRRWRLGASVWKNQTLKPRASFKNSNPNRDERKEP